LTADVGDDARGTAKASHSESLSVLRRSGGDASCGEAQKCGVGGVDLSRGFCAELVDATSVVEAFRRGAIAVFLTDQRAAIDRLRGVEVPAIADTIDSGTEKDGESSFGLFGALTRWIRRARAG
jgi:hypothetical protein